MATEHDSTDEANEPNEYGFAGDATAPEPERETKPAEGADGERVAVPAGDLTGAITGALEDSLVRDDDEKS
jgi:hypothetical protein